MATWTESGWTLSQQLHCVVSNGTNFFIQAANNRIYEFDTGSNTATEILNIASDLEANTIMPGGVNKFAISPSGKLYVVAHRYNPTRGTMQIWEGEDSGGWSWTKVYEEIVPDASPSSTGVYGAIWWLGSELVAIFTNVFESTWVTNYDSNYSIVYSSSGGVGTWNAGTIDVTAPLNQINSGPAQGGYDGTPLIVYNYDKTPPSTTWQTAVFYWDTGSKAFSKQCVVQERFVSSAPDYMISVNYHWYDDGVVPYTYSRSTSPCDGSPIATGSPTRVTPMRTIRHTSSDYGITNASGDLEFYQYTGSGWQQLETIVSPSPGSGVYPLAQFCYMIRKTTGFPYIVNYMAGAIRVYYRDTAISTTAEGVRLWVYKTQDGGISWSSRGVQTSD